MHRSTGQTAGRTRRRKLITLLFGVLLLGGLLSTSPAAADGDGFLTLSKSASQPGPFQPGDTFSYTLTVGCSNTVGSGCDAAQVTDTLPAPLVLDPSNPEPVVVVGPAPSDVTLDGDNGFTVDFTGDTGSGLTGLPTGQTVQIVVSVMVPEDATFDDAGTLTNTATVTADNAETKTDSADVTLEVPLVLDSTVTKNLTPDTPIPAVPGQSVQFEIGGANTSNAAVDELVVQDPADGAADPFEYLELTGIASITPPAGADTVQVDWQDADGVWHTGTATTPIPDDPNELLAGVDLAEVHGLRFTFSADGGTVPITPEDGQAAIVLDTETRDNVTDIPPGTTETVSNTASSQVNLGDDSSTPVTDDDTVVLERNPPSVAVDKSYAVDHLTPGQSTTATVRVTNGSTPVTEMVITDPAAGTPDFVAQGITFTGFTDGVEWPVAATGVSIQYTYDDGFTEGPKTSTDVDTIPGPTEGHRVSGYTITFTGPIDANAYANLPFTVTADPLPGDESVTTTNTASSQVTASNGEESDVVTDDADLTRDPLRVTTDVTKNIGNGELPGVPGAGTTVNISGQVCGTCADKEPSTTGSEYLQITDPPNPSAVPSDFWNHFDVTSFGPTDVPANADMTVEYWNGTEWVPLAGPVEGPATWTYTPTADEQDAIQGIRYTFTPKEGELLPPGFNVITYQNVELREELRDGTGPAVPDPEGDPITVGNEAGSEVHNPNAVDPTDNATADDDVVINPVPPGPGPDTIDKGWLVDGTPQQTGATVPSLSDDQRTARISWGTNLFPADQYVITDPATDPQNVATSLFDAWDLYRIEPITAATDPMMTFDAIASVELYVDGIGWVDITDDACANGCDGQFGGYTLSDEQRATTIGVRITYEESPTRAERITSPTDPQVGTGVARTAGNDRPLDLTFQLRQQLRSDPTQAVLGDTHDYTYNTDQAGLVRNTVDGTMISGDEERSTTDFADILIVDEPVNVDITKTFDQEVLGIPPVDTPQTDYPLITADLSATNDSVSKLRTLRIDDPSASPALQPEPFQTLNLYEIGEITTPAGATETVVLLYRDWSATPTAYSVAAAQALTPDELADVTGISVVHTGLIESQATADVELVFQLRVTNRVTGQPPTPSSTQIPNVAGVTGSNPHDTVTDQATDGFTLAEPTYGVLPGKTIAPAERYEDEPNQYLVTLSGQPTGTVRTEEMTLTDTTETFWNAFDFDSFAPLELQFPIRQLKVDALVGVTYELDGSGAPVALCNGATDLTACWVEGDWVQSGAGGAITPTLPSGVAADDVRGLRISARNEDGTQWERPNNPRLVVSFGATQRDTLRIGPDGGDDTPVPSTRPGMETAPGETVQGQTTDTVDVHAEGTWLNPDGTVWTADDDATATTLLRHLPNEIRVTKAPGNGSDTDPPSYVPAQSIPYVLLFQNTGQWPMTGLELSDQIATDAQGSLLVEPRDASGEPVPAYSFTLVGADGTPKSTAGFSASLNEQTGLLSITVPDGFVFEPGDTLTVRAPLQFRPGLPPGTSVGNSVTATSDRPFDTCQYTTNQTISSTSEVVDDCTATTHTTPRAASPLVVQKSVKGVGAGVAGAAEGDPNYDDLGRLVTGTGAPETCESPNGQNGYYRSPCVPITRPGGIERWQYSAQNAGNVPAHVIAGIDSFPRYGDVGVITGTPRGSEWETTIVGNPTSNLDEVDELAKSVTWYYLMDTPSSACNAADILNETTPGGIPTTDPCYDEVNGRAWTEVTDDTTEAELTGASAVKFVITYDEDGTGLAPGSAIHLTLDTRTAWAVDNGVNGEFPIAWNSVASGTQGVTGNQTIVSPVVEPTRVGVATAIGKLALQKQVEGADLPGVTYPDAYTFRVRCVSGPETVPLVDSDGNDASLVTLQADGTLVTYNSGQTINLPLYADCTLTEEPIAQGATVTYDPPGTDGTSGSITALNDQTDRDDVVDPAFPETVELAQITATNTYAVAGFSVSKAVENGGAVDQDGNPIVYDATYDFTASCLFNGQEVVPEADRTFSLDDGEEKVFDELPAGADCTVEETGTGGSASTSMVVTQPGAPGEPTDGTSGEFTLAPDDDGVHVNAVAVTNTYTVGAMTLTKEITGDGADQWGDGPFEVRLVCTLDNADPTTVYDATHTLTPPDDLTWEVTNLPTGADCTVTEPQNAGATDVAIENGTFTVGDDVDDPALVTVTNTFTVGSVSLTKELYGAANDLENVREVGHFEFTIACTRVVDGETVAVEIPGGDTRTIDYADGDPETVTWEGIPTGSTCAVEETVRTPTPIFWTVTPSTFTVGDETTGPVVLRGINIYAPGWLVLNKAVEGDAAQFAPDDFEVTVVCTRAGGNVALPNGGVVTLPGDGSPVFLAPIPEDSECQVESEAASGATEVDLGGPVTIPIFSAGPPVVLPRAEITVTNTYDATGFTVSKAVDGATDAEGEPITYTTEFTFTATCTFLGEEVLPEADRAFTLTQGQTKEFTGLPVGTECAVEETGAGSATGTAVEVTQDGAIVAPEDQTDTASGTFTLVGGGTTATLVGYTNTMPIGAITVTKEITGDGADRWGGGDFEVRLECTYDDADPTTVFDGTHTLSGADPSWTVDALPVGADCVVTETATGGATSSTVDPSGAVTITDDAEEPVAVTVTNTFDVGGLVVEKRITGPGADERGGKAFTVSLACTREVDGEDEEIEVPGGADRTLKRPDRLTATYDDLPVGAECVVTETDAGGAERTTIDPGSVTVGAADEPVEVVVTNRFDAAAASDDEGGSDLPGTGSPVSSWMAFLALALLAAGLTILRRRRPE
ncbi:DUF5979 domain-containing protein [Mumia sp. DW29H23]|uniref:DUF5979 domain-containing protein n=1 Tax=Mumia sp. DW29H23 TaxID=3421241 RepID=UPI003D697C62